MKNEIDALFADLRRRKKKALIAYMAAGYPKFEEQEKLVEAAVKAGVDLLEIGVPFSDPIADGPTIQFASERALENGVTLRKILAWVPRLRRRVHVPIVFMTYMNPLLAYGLDRFGRDAAKAGVSGVIVPDLIVEEAGPLEAALRKHGIHMIYLAAPTTPSARARYLSKRTRGFLYAVSVAGVTGARKTLPAATKAWLAGLHRTSPAPLCVGFGISGPEQIRALRNSVDGFIVGSAIIDVIRKNRPAARPAKLAAFVRSLVKECHHG